MVAEFAKGKIGQTRLDKTRLLKKHLPIQTFAQFTFLALLFLALPTASSPNVCKEYAMLAASMVSLFPYRPTSAEYMQTCRCKALSAPAVDGAASCSVVQSVMQSFTAAKDARKAIGKSTSRYATICHSVLNHILLLPCLKFTSKNDHT